MGNIISASIVLFNNDLKSLDNLLKSLTHKVNNIFIIYLIDNSPTDILSQMSLFDYMNVKYIHNCKNLGFGSGHNIALEKAIEINSKFHFIINPDIILSENVITRMVNYIEQNENVGMMMPQILNLDGSIQHLPKLLPSPLSILLRKIKHPVKLYSKFISKYELRFVPNDVSYNAPVLSGCFTLLNLNVIQEVGMYDDRFFMYFEDWDLSRRIHTKYQTIYFPKVSVYHGYESGANKSGRLFKVFIKSAIRYFNKWGWFFDFERKKINDNTLMQFR